MNNPIEYNLKQMLIEDINLLKIIYAYNVVYIPIYHEDITYHTSYYANGKLYEEYTVSKNKMNGKYVKYYSNGKKE